MWRRFRRRSMAPSRPLMFGEQLALVLLVVIAIGAGIWVVARAF